MMTMHGKLCCSEERPFRRPSTREVAKVTRCLFGPVDHDEARRFLEENMKSMSSKHRSDWSFDFERECPTSPTTDDRYVWERVGEPIPYRTTETNEPTRQQPIKSDSDKVIVNEPITNHLDISSSAQFDRTLAEAARRCLNSKHKVRRVSTRKTTIPG